jgi:hypothetical protein
MDTRTKALTAMMVLSVLAGTLVAVSAALEPTISSSTGEPRGRHALGASPDGGVLGYNVTWDNGMNYDFLGASQNDTVYPFECLLADDFIFTENQIVRDVHWIGGYWNGPPDDGDFDWEITFYNDNGTGNQPGTVIASFYFLNADTHETYFGPYYNYSVDLPAPVEFAANTKYWISVQGIGYFPPQSAWAMHYDPILLHQALFKSDYFGYHEWTNSSEVWGDPYDMCFQLTGGEAEVPALTPIGLIALVSLLSAIAAVAIIRKRR